MRYKVLPLPAAQEEVREQVKVLSWKKAELEREPGQEKERLLQKRGRLVKLYSEGYLSERDFQVEMAAVELGLYQLEQPFRARVSSWETIQQAAAQLPRKICRKGTSLCQVARRYGVSYASVRRVHQAWRELHPEGPTSQEE
ncbi:hypothetical protein KTAU_08360 [Thermogemmatispora aurantia]|uniref:Uncharacterized protein n=1 Tax=Thermogemmatispora aurantia TaxID=2045279 RepID=A0A5J4JY90_9CHLR|nr:hypothetical protein KTAU_08360 [Thermogemmatispora aurantia]